MVHHRTLRGVLSAALSTCVLAACGGGGIAPAGSSGVSASIAPATPAAGSGTLSITIVVPTATTSSATARTPKYISPNTQSVSIALSGGTTPLAIANLSAATPGCTAVTAGLSCTITATAPAGNDTFVVSAFDGTNGTGNKLSTASVASAVTANATTRLPLTLNGVVATVGVTLGSGSGGAANGAASPAPLVAAGTAASIAVIVTAYDASHNAIVGPGTFDTPVTLTDSDATTATMLTGAPGTAPAKTLSITAPGTSVTLTYSGNSLASATITPSVNGAAGTSATFTPYGASVALYSLPGSAEEDTSLVRGVAGDLWFGSDNYDVAVYGNVALNGRVSNTGSSATSTFRFSALGTGSGSNAIAYADSYGLTVGAIDPAGGMHVATQQSPPCALNSGATTCGTVYNMAATSDGNVWFVDYGKSLIGVMTPMLQVFEYNPQNVPGWSGNLPTPFSITVGPDGALYVGEQDEQLDRYVVAGTQLSSVSHLFNGSNCVYPIQAITTGPDGKMWFADECGNLAVVPPGSGFSQANVLAWNVSVSAAYLAANAGTLVLAESNDSNLRVVNIAGVSQATAPTISVIPLSFTSTGNGISGLATAADNNVWAMLSQDCGDSSALAKVVIGGAGVYSQSSAVTRASTTLSSRRLPQGRVPRRKHAR